MTLHCRARYSSAAALMRLPVVACDTGDLLGIGGIGHAEEACSSGVKRIAGRVIPLDVPASGRREMEVRVEEAAVARADVLDGMPERVQEYGAAETASYDGTARIKMRAHHLIRFRSGLRCSERGASGETSSRGASGIKPNRASTS